MKKKKTLAESIAGFVCVALFLAALYFLSMSTRHQYIEHYKMAVRQYETGEYQEALEGFLDVLEVNESVFDGLPPTEYIRLCNSHLGKELRYCPYCGHPMTEDMLEEAP